jgi:hypothetical protein
MVASKVRIDNTGARGSFTRFEWFIIAYGIILRLTQYLSNRSLWFDESRLALNIVNRSFSQLLKRLDYGQGAPVGFLMLEKAAVRVLGSSEYGLRFFPLLCGVISLLLFYRLAKLSISPKAVPIALGLFALSGPLIYYSSEVKQYSSDVAVAVLLLCAAIYYESREVNRWAVVAFGLLGAASIWFSHPSAFVSAGVGLSLALFCLAQRGWPRLAGFLVVFSMWALSFVACYGISLRQLSNDKNLLSYWSFGFVPSPLLSLVAVKWFIDTFFGIFRNPAGLELSGIAALTFLVGCSSMFSKRAEKSFILMSPLIPTLIAAGLHKYPFSGRLLLFIVPILLLFIAEGAEQIWSKTKDDAPIIGACLIGLLFLQTLLFSTYHLIKPSAGELPPGIAHTREEIKPVMKYIENHRDEGDVLYVYLTAEPAFRYYAPRYSLSNVDLIPGSSNNWEDYEKELNQLRGYRRVWLLFSHIDTDAGVNEEGLFVYFANKRGTRLDYFQSLGAAAFLYDLDQPNASH